VPTVGKYKLVRQLGGKGRFAEVWLSAEPAPAFSVAFDDCDALEKLPDGTPYYATAVTFGIRIALEKIDFVHGHRGPRYHLSVLRIASTVVDSTEAIVAMAAAHATFNALKRNDVLMSIDDEGRFVRLFLP
jgi:hypothetical protein